MFVYVVAFVLGLLAGALANWAADVLPRLNRPAETPASASQGPRGLGEGERVNPGATPRRDPARWSASARLTTLPPWHYLTLPWYFVAHGVCPHCGAARPWRGPVLEAAMVLGFLAAAWRFSAQPFQLLVAWLYILFLLAVLVIDYEHRLVLNVMTGPAAVTAFLISFGPGMPGPVLSLAGGLAGLLLFLLLALVSRGHLGGGDVKLAGVIGLMLGFPAALTALLAGVFFAGLAAIVLLLARRAGRKSYMAYAPYLSLGALAVLLRFLGQ